MGKQLYEKKNEKNFTKTLQKREGGKRERERATESLQLHVLMLSNWKSNVSEILQTP